MKVLLVGNYETDRQESMLRFAACLERELPRHGIATELLLPPARLGRLKRGGHGLGKWLGYVDKFVLFPGQLRRRVAQLRGDDVLVHVCDHSNSPYLRGVAERRSLVTCHDLLAVRGALGEETDCPASFTGRFLQRAILCGLTRADLVVCDSAATRNDFERLTGGRRRSQVVLLGLNQEFRRLTLAESRTRLGEWPELRDGKPFLLHVGSSLRRKNREGILRIMARLKERWPGLIVFAGDELGADQRVLAEQLGVRERVREVRRPSHEVLEALYHRAHALLYPSRFEGFGWPILEAQACDCPVISADTTSLPEVAGAGAVLLPVADEGAFAEAVLRLANAAERESLIAHGRANIQRFSTDRMIADYAQIYRQLAGPA